MLSADGGATFPTTISERLPAGFQRQIRLGASAEDAYVPGKLGEIAATTNGGASWGMLRVPGPQEVDDVAFPTTEVGYAVNTEGIVYRTATSGVTWSILSSGGPAPSALLAPSTTEALLVGPVGVRRTLNSGASFASINTPIVIGHRHHRAIKRNLTRFDLSGGGQVVGPAIFAYGEELIESTDGGARWTLIPRPCHVRRSKGSTSSTPPPDTWSRQGGLYFTRDSGGRWSEVRALGDEAEGGVDHVSFSSPLDGYATVQYAGSDAYDILHTSNGGGAGRRSS